VGDEATVLLLDFFSVFLALGEVQRLLARVASGRVLVAEASRIASLVNAGRRAFPLQNHPCPRIRRIVTQLG